MSDAFKSVRTRLSQLEEDTLTGVNNIIHDRLGEVAFINSGVAANISAATGLNVSDWKSANMQTISADFVTRYWSGEPAKALLRASASAVAPTPLSLYNAVNARLAELVNENATTLSLNPVVRAEEAKEEKGARAAGRIEDSLLHALCVTRTQRVEPFLTPAVLPAPSLPPPRTRASSRRFSRTFRGARTPTSRVTS